MERSPLRFIHVLRCHNSVEAQIERNHSRRVRQLQEEARQQRRDVALDHRRFWAEQQVPPSMHSFAWAVCRVSLKTPEKNRPS